MYPTFHDDCSSEIIQQTIDYGTAVRSSSSTKPTTSPLAAYHNMVSYSIGHNCPSLNNDKSTWCQTSPKKEVDNNVSAYNPDISAGDHKIDETPSKISMTPKTRLQMQTDYQSFTFNGKNQKKETKPGRLRWRLSLKRMCVRRWNIIKKTVNRKMEGTPEKPKKEVPVCISIQGPLYREFGTEMTVTQPKTAATVTSRWLRGIRSKQVRDVSGATSRICPTFVSTYTSNNDMLKPLSARKIYHQTGTQITKSYFQNHGPPGKRKTVSFSGGSSDVTKLSSLYTRRNLECTVMTEKSIQGSPFRNTHTLLARSVNPEKPSNMIDKFCPSKWADVVVNRIIQNIGPKVEKGLKTKSFGTRMTPVQIISFSNHPPSFDSIANGHRSLNLISTKSSQGHCNILNELGTQNSNMELPMCSSDLAEKVAKKIIFHMQWNSQWKQETQECGTSVDDDAHEISKPEPMTLEDTEKPLEIETKISEGLTKLTVLNDEVEDNEPLQTIEQEISNYIAPQPPAIESDSSSESTNLDTSPKTDLVSDHVAIQPSKQTVLSCTLTQDQDPVSDCVATRQSKQTILSYTLIQHPESGPPECDCCELPTPKSESETSKISKTLPVLHTGTDPEPEVDEEFDNIVEQLASQIASEVDKLKAFALKAYPLTRPAYSENKVKIPTFQPTAEENVDPHVTTVFSMKTATVNEVVTQLTQTDYDATAQPVTPATVIPKHISNEDTKTNTSFHQMECCGMVTETPRVISDSTSAINCSKCDKSQSHKFNVPCRCQSLNCGCDCAQIVNLKSVSVCGSKSETRLKPILSATKHIPISSNHFLPVPTRSESTQFLEEDDSDCEVSFVQYISNLVTDKLAQVKSKFNNRDEPLPAFQACQALFKAWHVHDSSPVSRHDSLVQTSPAKKPRGHCCPLQRAYMTPLPVENSICKSLQPKSVWEARICTIHRSKGFESSCESSHTAWCVRVRQSSLVNHAFSVTDIGGTEKEKLSDVYFMLSALEGRVRRVKCGSRLIC